MFFPALAEDNQINENNMTVRSEKIKSESRLLELYLEINMHFYSLYPYKKCLISLLVICFFFSEMFLKLLLSIHDTQV